MTNTDTANDNDEFTPGDTIDIKNIQYRVENVHRDDDMKCAELIEDIGPGGVIEDPERRELIEVTGETFLVRPDDGIDVELLPECADVAEEAVCLAGITAGPGDATELVEDVVAQKLTQQ